MKRYTCLCLMLASLLLFTSCHKSQTPSPPEAKEYNLNLNVGFSQTITSYNSLRNLAVLKQDATTALDSVKQYLSVLYFHVFDSNMHEIRHIVQNSTDTNFGNVNIQLADGDYTVIVDGGDSGFQENSSVQITAPGSGFSYPAMAYQYTNSFVYPANSNSAPFKTNTFYKKLTTTINNNSASLNVRLDRIAAQLKIVIQDAVPSIAKSLTVMVNNDAQALSLDKLIPDYATGSYYYNITPVTPGSQPAAIYIPIANTTTPLSVEIKSTSSVVNDISQINSYTVVGDKLITGVTCAPNATTILSGKLFGITGQGFNITYNPAWDPGPPTIVHF